MKYIYLEVAIMGNSIKYMEQWQRVGRWHNRFREISEGVLLERESDYYQDVVFAFFINCYHLKDWIKNDSCAGVLRDEVEKYVSSNLELAICGDICNGLKHLKLKATTKSKQNPIWGKRDFKLKLGNERPKFSASYGIDTKSGSVDAFDLANRCIALWASFIDRKEGKNGNV